jgi:hypothetical protein
MDEATWLKWQKDLNWSDEDMVYFYGKPGDPVDTSDVDDFFTGGGQLEGIPIDPMYARIVERGEKFTVIVGPAIEAWLLINFGVLDRTQGEIKGYWVLSERAFMTMCLRFKVIQ